MRNSEASVGVFQRLVDGKSQWLLRWNHRWERYSFIGGHREGDETPRECLVREIEEEIGFIDGREYSIVREYPIPVEFEAWSESAQEQTHYRFSLFDVKLADTSVVVSDPKLRWVALPEIEACQCRDGHRIGEVVKRLIAGSSTCLGGGDAAKTLSERSAHLSPPT